MTVNAADIIIVVFIALTCLIGYIRGILFSLIRFLRVTCGLFLCFYFSNYYSQPIYESLVKPRLLETINEKIVLSGNIDEVLTNLNNYIDSFPKFFSDYFQVSQINISSDDISQAILTNVFEPVAVKLTKIAIFIIVFLIFFISTAIILYFVKKRYDRKNDDGKNSKIKKTDKILGIVFGLLKGMIITFAVVSVTSFIFTLYDLLSCKYA